MNDVLAFVFHVKCFNEKLVRSNYLKQQIKIISMLYSHMLQLYTYTYACRINDTIIKMSEDFFRKICTSHFICKVVCERELEAEQRLQHIDLPSPSGHRHVSFLFSWTAQPGAQPLWDMFSFQHLLTNWSGLQTRWGSWGPLLLGGGFLNHILSLTHFISNSLTSRLHRVI